MDTPPPDAEARNGHSADDMPPGLFATTRWSVVLRAGEGEGPRREVALDELCRRYWRPLFCYSRGMGFDLEASADLVQGFVARLASEDWGLIRRADPARGRFRAFLLTAFRNHCVSEGRRVRAAKRGGRISFLSLDQLLEADAGLGGFSAPSKDPESGFDRAWASEILNSALRRTRAAFAERRMEEVFDALEPSLMRDGTAETLATVSTQVNRPVGTLKSDLHRMRGMIREFLRSEIAETVCDGESFESEIRHFSNSFARA